MRTVTVAGRRFQVDPRVVEHALVDVLPEPIKDHFIIVAGRRWPPKQVLGLVTGLDRADFTTHQARRILTRLGFSAARARAQTTGAPYSASAAFATGSSTAEQIRLVEALRPFIGQWVAVRDDDVLVAAASPSQVIAWLTEHGQHAQSMFRVPGSDQAIGGAAPL